jgi:curved DNA-binding protein CbpA
MKTPFEILGLPELATDQEIRRAYLAKVREYPPEREPERFQEIRAAFEAIQDRRARLKYQLFHHELPGISVLLQSRVRPREHCRPDQKLLLRVLAASLGKRSS